VKTVTVNDNTYTIKLMQPWLQPYLAKYQALAHKPGETIEDVEKAEADIKKCVDKLISTLVSPKPTDDDVGEVFIALMTHIAEIGKKYEKEANSFRQDENRSNSG